MKMMDIIHKVSYYISFAILYVVSSLPLCVHYFFSDLWFVVLFHVVKYRREVVHENIRSSFPDLTDEECLKIERGFYHHLCDLAFESIKYFTISEKEIRKRMVFRGAEKLTQSGKDGKHCALYLGHYGNWEWVGSMSLWLDKRYNNTMQLYHPLSIYVVDRFMDHVRGRWGSINIPDGHSLRYMARFRRENTFVTLGLVADQTPMYRDIHFWMPFLNHDTGVFTGGERITKMMDMDVYYLHIRKVKRGYYEGEVISITDHAKDEPEFAITRKYMNLLEENIKEDPSLWLWTHRRWKRNHETWKEEMHLLKRDSEIEKQEGEVKSEKIKVKS